MSKEIKFGVDARNALLAGVDQLADTEDSAVIDAWRNNEPVDSGSHDDRADSWQDDLLRSDIYLDLMLPCVFCYAHFYLRFDIVKPVRYPRSGYRKDAMVDDTISKRKRHLFFTEKVPFFLWY